MDIEKELRELRKHFRSDGAHCATVNLPAGQAWAPASPGHPPGADTRTPHGARESVPGK